MNWACLVVLLVACRSESKPAPPVSQGSAASLPPPVPASAPKPAQAAPTVRLPTNGFDVTRVLGHTKADVDKELGHAEQLEDGPWEYDAFRPVAIAVLFDTGKAAYVSVEPPQFERTPSNLASVQAWEHAPADADYDHLHNFEDEVIIWAPGMQERQAHRREMAKQISESLKSSQAFAAANGTDLEISAPPGKCDRGVLHSVANSAGGSVELKRLGFNIMECSGVENTTLRL